MAIGRVSEIARGRFSLLWPQKTRQIIFCRLVPLWDDFA